MKPLDKTPPDPQTTASAAPPAGHLTVAPSAIGAARPTPAARGDDNAIRPAAMGPAQTGQRTLLSSKSSTGRSKAGDVALERGTTPVPDLNRWHDDAVSTGPDAKRPPPVTKAPDVAMKSGVTQVPDLAGWVDDGEPAKDPPRSGP